MCDMLFFFFKQKTAYEMRISDWSSDVCSSDLYVYRTVAEQPQNQNDREIAALFDRWNAALKTGSAAAVTSLYAPDAILQPTVSNQVRNTAALIQDYFEHFLAGKPVGQINYREIRHQLGRASCRERVCQYE